MSSPVSRDTARSDLRALYGPPDHSKLCLRAADAEIRSLRSKVEVLSARLPQQERALRDTREALAEERRRKFYDWFGTSSADPDDDRGAWCK